MNFHDHKKLEKAEESENNTKNEQKETSAPETIKQKELENDNSDSIECMESDNLSEQLTDNKIQVDEDVDAEEGDEQPIEIEQDIQEQVEKILVYEIVETTLNNFFENYDYNKVSSRISADLKIVVQSFYSKILEYLEDTRGRFAYRSQSSFIKGLIGVHDLLQQLEKNAAESPEEIHIKNYGNIRNQLIQVFFMHDIEPIKPKPNDIFNPELHKAIAQDETAVAEEDSTISDCIRTGFILRDILIRPAEVKVKKLISDKNET